MRRVFWVQKFTIFILFLLVVQSSSAQNVENNFSSVYQINRKFEIPATIGILAFNFYGFSLVDAKPRLDAKDIAGLDANDIWKFDRCATTQDASFRKQAHQISDYIMNPTIILPAFLTIDKNIRRDWIDLLVLYGETHAFATGVYLLGAGTIDRIRPFVYHPDIPEENKYVSGTKNSFFSGHTATTASASFFMAKVYSDYHPELGNKKYWLYGAALIPPALVAYYRVKAMKHFPSDVILGGIVGTASGILTPHFHKTKKVDANLSIVLMAGIYNGVKLTYSIR